MSSKSSYYLSFLSITAFSITLSFGLSKIDNNYFNSPHFWLPTLFFVLTTLGINYVLTRSEKESKEFIFKTLALSMARLLLCMVFMLIYSLVNKPQALAFACHFMIQYIIFTVFEISFLLKYIKTAK